MDARNNIATDLFYKIRSRFSGLKLGAETGEITINPEEARFFDFDYMEGEVPVGHVSISLAEPNSMKIYFSHGITETMDSKQKTNWYGFLRELRQFAKRRLLAFDTRDIAKDNLDKRDYEFLSQNAHPKQQPNTIQTPVGESVMNESAMYGSKTMSYQKLMDTRLIIKHSQAVMDDTQPGARTRHISALFVENQDGERFKYPFIHLAGARAMQRHVANGGLPYDEIGKSIIGMSEEIAQLKSFGNYVVRNDLMNSSTNGIVERSTQYLNGIRETIQRLSKQKYYEQYREAFQAQQPVEVPQDVIEDFTEKFTVRNFKEDIKSVFPVLYRLMQEDNTLGYDDIVAMTQATQESQVEESESQAYDPFAKFENWALGLGETSAIDSEFEEEQAAAIQELQELVSTAFPVGVDGTNAIESLKGIIADPSFSQELKDASKQDPEFDARALVYAWLEEKAPEVLDQLDWGDFQPDSNVEDPMAYANDAADADAEYYGQQEGYNMNEAERPKRTKPGYKWQRGPSSKEFGAPDVPLNGPYDKKAWEPYYDWTKSEKGQEYSAAQKAHFAAQQAAKAKHAGVSEKDFDTTLTIKNPFFDPNGPEDEDDPNFEAEEIDVGIDYDYEYQGEYRPATWGYHGGDPEEFPELEITVNRVVDLDSGEDITKYVDEDEIMKYLEDEVPSWRDAPKDRDYDDYDRYESADAEQGRPSGKINVQELAEFIKSFYDRESNTFPKGPEGVCTMVGKKFGEQAEQVARKFVERMAPQQTSPELQELARIKQLSGLRPESVEEADDRPGYIKYEEMKDQLSSVFIKLYNKGSDPSDIAKMYDEIAAKLGYDPNDSIFKQAWSSVLHGTDFPERDEWDTDDYTDYSMRKGEMGESSELEAIKRLSGITKGLGL